VIGTKRDRGAQKLVWLDLVSLDRAAGRGAVVYVPAHSAAEVPGRGLQDLSDAYSTGGLPLLLVTAENLLGVRIDHYLVMPSSGARALLATLGPLPVDVPDQVTVPAGHREARVLFRPGLQRLSADFLVSLLYTVGLDGDDQELGSRNLAFWDALLDRFAADPGALRSAVATGGAALESDTPPSDDASAIAGLASLPPSHRTVAQLPVEQVSVGGSELYRSDEQELDEFLTDALGEVSGPSRRASVQVLNGNGVPGIGQRVAHLLVGHGFRVFLSGNAPDFPDEEHTKIVVYSPGEGAFRLAERARDLLGVGKIRVSAQRQGIVEMTIVVGKDFLTRP
jgi:anionic cell wall polymer biosynthesis LytR-Cps2A-Psr (LCP) family protein